MRTTPIYGFNLPEDDDLYNVDDYNENFEAIDTLIASGGGGAGTSGTAVGATGIYGRVTVNGID